MDEIKNITGIGVFSVVFSDLYEDLTAHRQLGD